MRILIWLDHMGLRVATLVNLSFLGMDRLEQRLARLLAPAATARCIPEGVKRFTTWAPLLIPFYIPRGKDWDHAWSRPRRFTAVSRPDLLATLAALPLQREAPHAGRSRRRYARRSSRPSAGCKLRWASPSPSTLSLQPLRVRGDAPGRRGDCQPDSGARL